MSGERISGWMMLWAGLLFSPAAYSAPAEYTQAQIEAVVVYHLVQFIEWPSQAFSDPSSSLNLCTLDTAEMASPYSELNGREVRGRAIRVRELDNPDSNGCHILVLGNMDEAKRSQFLQQLADTPLLTVSDAPDFARKGGMIGLFVEKKRVRFAINLTATQQAGLKISARLLKLAHSIER